MDLIFENFLREDLRDSTLNNLEAFKSLLFKREIFNLSQTLKKTTKQQLKNPDTPPVKHKPKKAKTNKQNPQKPLHKNVL